jgi:uncharacterized protein DUF2188
MATTQEARVVYHVMMHEGKWVVKREAAPSGEFDAFETKDEAIERARIKANRALPSQVIVHRVDGTFEQEFSYGNDPYPPRG